MRRLMMFALLASAAVSAAAEAAPLQCVIETYSTHNGLANDRIADIYTDSRGYVWLCTWYGVSRFDGYTFKNYNAMSVAEAPMVNQRFSSVSEDADGHLWFTSYNYRLYRFNCFTEQFEDAVALVENDEVRHYRTNALLHDRSGATWVSIAGFGVVKFSGRPDASPVRVEAVYGLRELGDEVSALHVDARGRCRVATVDGGIVELESGPDARVGRLREAGGEPVTAFSELADAVYGLTAAGLVRIGDTGVAECGSPARLTAMAVDTLHRRLYAGGRGGELFVLEPPAAELRRIAAAGVRLQRIRDLAADSHGTLWITTPEAGITRYDPVRNDCRHFEQEPYTVSYNIDSLTKVAEGGGLVWIKMNRYGFGYYDREHDRVEPFYNDPRRPDCRMTNAVVRFDVRPDGVLWFSTYYERGLRRSVMLDQPAEMLTPDSRFGDELSGDIRAMMNDRRGRMWCGTKNGELFCYGADGTLCHRFPQDDRPLGMIYALKEDSAGNIWVGTKGDGLYRLRPRGDRYDFTHYLHSDYDPYSLGDDQIYAIEEDTAGRIWVATYGGGLNMLENADSRRFIHAGNALKLYPSEAGGRVRFLLSDAPDRMLAATVEGLLVFNPNEHPKQMHFELVQHIPGDGRSLGGDDIIHMLKDSKGRVWLATYGGGLNLIEEYSRGVPRFRRYSQEEGLQSNLCMALTEDLQGDLWVSTYNGVSRFDADRQLFSNYTLYDNMRTAIFSEATALTTGSGAVCFGSGKNIYRFHPEQMRKRPVDYRLRFTGLEMCNRPVAVGSSSPLRASLMTSDCVVLPYDYSNFRVEFAALNYAVQDRVNYMYKLEGYDQDWIVAGKFNRAAYSNVPYGRYKLIVKAFVDAVDEADEGAVLRIDIRPPLWWTWWAKTIYLLLLIGAAVVAWRVFHSVMRIRREAQIEQDTTDMKLRFFTNISHELRTPLTLILGGIEDVRKHDNLSQRGDISLNLAYKNAKRMLTLINQLLDFRKVVKNKMELKISRVDLVPMVEDVLEDFREMAAERNIELLYTVSRRSVLVWVDIERIESVVYNLLSNALKFTRGGGRIEVILSVREAEECVILTVRDTGVGIPKERLTSIFERFSQASRPVDSNMKGSGIGLSLCRDIVLLHHGEITVESRQGEGSSFNVRLRMGNAHFGMEQIDFSEAPEGGKHRNSYVVSDYTPADTQHRTDVEPPVDAQKILLVEDNRELRLFMYNSLIDTYRVVEADDGVEALEKIRSELPDIIVTDLMMPNMDGIELIDKVRHDFTMSHIPIVMLTARHSPDDRVKAMEYGADGYITKPFSIELLLARIDNLLTQRRKLFEKFSSQSARNKVVELKPEEVVVTNRDEAFMKEVMKWLEARIEDSALTIDQLASHLGMGRTTMYNKLKSLTGKSPIELIKEYRITKSRLLLRTGQFSVSEVAYKVGFSDPGYFSRCFKEQFNMSPAEYLKTHNLKQNQETK